MSVFFIMRTAIFTYNSNELMQMLRANREESSLTASALKLFLKDGSKSSVCLLLLTLFVAFSGPTSPYEYSPPPS